MKLPQFEHQAQIEEKHWWFSARRTILRQLLHQAIPPSKKIRVVDMGCGTGGNIAALGEGYFCIGVDPSADAIHLARSRFPGIEFIHSSTWETTAPLVASAQGVLLTDVLEHVPDDFLFFSELLSHTSPGTYLLVTVPADRSLWSPHDVGVGHYRRYERSDLEELWGGLPVSVKLISHFNSRLYPLVKALRVFNRWQQKAMGSAETDLWMPWAFINRSLENLFAGEAHRLVDLLKGKRSQGFSAGVSLIALLRREAGAVYSRNRSPQMPADQRLQGRQPC